MHPSKSRFFRLLIIVIALVTWTLANGLDIVSMFLFIRLGYRPLLSNSLVGLHPVEFVLLYAGLRVLGTIAAGLMALWVEKHWSPKTSAFWAALIVAALLTALFAWLRLN